MPGRLVIDDRSEPVAWRVRGLQGWNIAGHPGSLTRLQRQLLRKLYRQIDPKRDRRHQRMLWLGAIACFAVYGVTIWFDAAGVMRGGLAGAGAMCMLQAVMHNRWIPTTSPERLRRPLLRMDLCAACAHSLRGLPREADGCVVCPECGGAWRIDAITRSLPPVA